MSAMQEKLFIAWEWLARTPVRCFSKNKLHTYTISHDCFRTKKAGLARSQWQGRQRDCHDMLSLIRFIQKSDAKDMAAACRREFKRLNEQERSLRRLIYQCSPFVNNPLVHEFVRVCHDAVLILRASSAMDQLFAYQPADAVISNRIEGAA